MHLAKPVALTELVTEVARAGGPCPPIDLVSKPPAGLPRGRSRKADDVRARTRITSHSVNSPSTFCESKGWEGLALRRCRAGLTPPGLPHHTPKFPHHFDCEVLTGITLDHAARRIAGAHSEVHERHAPVGIGRRCRSYLLPSSGRVAVTTATPEHRPVLLPTVEVTSHSVSCACVPREAYPGHHSHCADQL